MQQRRMLVQIEQTEDDGDYLYDLPHPPRSGQQPDQVENEKEDRYQYQQCNDRHDTFLSAARSERRFPAYIPVEMCDEEHATGLKVPA